MSIKYEINKKKKILKRISLYKNILVFTYTKGVYIILINTSVTVKHNIKIIFGIQFSHHDESPCILKSLATSLRSL